MALSFLNHVYFLNIDGKVLHHLHYSKKECLVQPTFSPNSQKIAFKYMTEGHTRVTEIVYFTPQGKELTRVKIPAGKLIPKLIEKAKKKEKKTTKEKNTTTDK